jgi:hypothetical protein
VYANRFFEFVQQDVVDENDHPAGLPSVFAREHRDPHRNKTYETECQSLNFDARSLEHWDEYFGRFQIPKAKKLEHSKIY